MVLTQRMTMALAFCSAAWLAGCAHQAAIAPVAQDSSTSSHTRCLTAHEISQWAQAFSTKRPVPNPPAGMTAADAACTRVKYQQQLVRLEGPLVGYKVALSNLHIQKTFHADEPVWGSYHVAMFWPGNSHVSHQYGVHPLYKAGLLVRVKSSAINQAQTPEEALAAIDQIIPFIELADVQVQSPSQLTAHNIAAINTATRMGIVGEPLTVPQATNKQKKLLKELETMSVRVIGNKGRLLGRGQGKDVMEHPLRSVIWLAQALKKQGLSLQPGQYVNVGTFSPMLRPTAGEQVTVAYLGLTGARSVMVKFE